MFGVWWLLLANHQSMWSLGRPTWLSGSGIAANLTAYTSQSQTFPSYRGRAEFTHRMYASYILKVMRWTPATQQTPFTPRRATCGAFSPSGLCPKTVPNLPSRACRKCIFRRSSRRCHARLAAAFRAQACSLRTAIGGRHRRRHKCATATLRFHYKL